MITVGLPVFKSKDIIWLAMEGLCNQKTSHKWELLICEENHKEQVGSVFFDSYKSRLKKANCVRIKYISPDSWIPLALKWDKMIKQARGSVFIMQDADDYSDSSRIERTYNKIKRSCFYSEENGYFYNLQNRKMVKYKHVANNRCGVNKAFKTKYARNLQYDGRNKYVDSWLFENIKQSAGQKFKHYLYKKETKSLFCDGVNNISIDRGGVYDNPVIPFHNTDKRIYDLLDVKTAQKLLLVKHKDVNRKRPGEYDMSLDCFPVNKSNAIRSLIIPAYNADWCLHDCVNSVIKQENKKFDEIIIAVDHCRKTLLTSLELSKKYPQIQVLWMTRHSHAYNTINAGLHYANGNILYVFGADDIMYENYTTEMEKNKSDIVCASGKTIEKGKVKKILKHTFGAIKISRTALEKLNYYEDWKCAADFELITRAKYSGIQVSHTNKDVMLIRKHDKNLTRKADTGMSSSLRTKYHTEIKNREKSLYQKTTKTILDYIQIKHGDPIPDVIKEEPPPIQTQVEKHKPKLVVVVCAVNIEIKKIEEWLQWNKENIEKINGAYLIVGFNMNAPIMEKYSPSKCSNAGIRKAIDSGADVVIKTDIDCKLSLDFLELASELEPGRCECPVCFFSGKSENRYKEAQCGTVAMHAKNWNDLYGYDERMYGYGWEDGDLIARIERKKIKISRHRDKFLIHVEHPKRFGSNWYPVNRNKNKSFRSWRSQNWGL